MGNEKSKTSKNKETNILNVPKTELVDKYNRRFHVTKDSILNGDDLANWLTDYLKEQDNNDLNTIKEDLQSPFSKLKEKMDDDFQKKELNEGEVGEIYTFLKDDIFSDEDINGNEDSSYNFGRRGGSVIIKDLQLESDSSIIIDPQLQIAGNDLGDEYFLHVETSETGSRRSSVGSVGHGRNDTVELFVKTASQTLRGTKISMQKIKTPDQEFELKEDVYTRNKEPFPEFINVALFSRSDDEYLERLIDKAILKVCYSKTFEKLWNDKKFIKSIYDNEKFPEAVTKIFDLINSDDNNDGLDFIGSFVNKTFKRQINDHKKGIEEKAYEEKEEKQNENKENDNDTENKYDENKFDIEDLNENDEKIYLVWIDGEVYQIELKEPEYKSQKRRHKTLNKQSHFLFELKVNHNENTDEFCWSVFKKKSVRNTYGIKTKGYWEIIESYDDDKREIAREEIREQKRKQKEIDNQINDSRRGLFGRRNKTTNRVLNLDVLSGDDDDENTSRDPTPEATDESKSPEPQVRRASTTRGGFQYVPLEYLNIMFELLQYHYLHSVMNDKEKQQIARKRATFVNAPLYDAYCKGKRTQNRGTEYRITINEELYRLSWWNENGRLKCNSMCVFVDDEEREYFYMRFKYKVDTMRWDWYDNDKAKYNVYHCGNNNKVYKELEATFQSNIDDIFPATRFSRLNKNIHRFDVCVLPQLKKYLENNPPFIKSTTFILRFTFTMTKNRILNMEQLSLRGNQQPFPRNVRRLIKKANSLQTYWQNTNEFIEEWKRRYLLSSKQQQLYFLSYILSIATIIKYIEIEFQHQMISLPYQTEKKNKNNKFKGLDDSDLQRHKIDYKLWRGFFVPPTNQLQTASISKNMNSEKDLENWHENLSRVESLKKFIYRANDDKNELLAKTDKVKIGCTHKFKKGDVLWLAETTYDVYCSKCARLLQFSECIRKYVLEKQNDEVIDFLWPWYRNYWHRGDSQKYHKYIAKYNLSRLFMTLDVLPDFNRNEEEAENAQKQFDQNEIRSFLKQINMSRYNFTIRNNGIDDLDELQELTEEDLSDKLEINRADHRSEIWKGIEKLKNKNKHVRHWRKFAGSCLLSPWDILRNLNIIRNQLQSLFKFIEDDNKLSDEQKLMSFALTRAAYNKDANITDKEIIARLTESYKIFKNLDEQEEKKADAKQNTEGSWEYWNKMINESNCELKKQLENSDREQLLELTSAFVLEDEQKTTVSALLSSILNEESKKQNVDEKPEEDMRYYREFENSWHKTPEWWTDEHDILLLELSLKYNWNIELIGKELTDPSKKLYYQQLLQQEPDLADENQYADEKKEEKYNVQEVKNDAEDEKNNPPDVNDVPKIISILEDIDFDVLQLEEHKQTTIDWFKENDIGYSKFKQMSRKDFAKQLSEKCGDKKLKGKIVKLHKAICAHEVAKMVNMLNDIDFGKLEKHREKIIKWFEKDNIDKNAFSAMNRKDFAGKLAKKCDDKKAKALAAKLFKTIQSKTESNMMEILEEIDFGKLSEYKQQIIEIFETEKITKESFIKMKRKDFIKHVTEKCNDKKLTSGATKLHKTITTKITPKKKKKDVKNVDEKKAEPEEEKKDEFPDIFLEDDNVDFEHRGYQEFQVWMENWRNIQHRLRYLTFIICKYLNKCKPSIVEIRIPKKRDQVPQYNINSFVFLNGYIKKVHEENCIERAKDLVDVNSKNTMLAEMATKKDEHQKRIWLRRKLKTAHESIDFDAKTDISRQIFTRDPFMKRDLNFELEQICKSFDLLEYGVEMAFFLIKLLTRKQIDSLWSALGIVLEYMPYEKARFVLSQKQEDLRHGEPEHLKRVCDRIRKGSSFSVHICLFLADYMEDNAEQDLARYDKWMEFSKYYESEAGKTINDIESDHLLSVFMDIPLSESGKQKVSLLQVALEQNRAQFLNNERINAVLKHVWQTPSGLDPNIEILRKPFTSGEILGLLSDQPYHFYLTPMGFNSTIKSLHLLYVLAIFIFMANRIYLDDPISSGEWFLWTLNIGYFVYEVIEAYDKGIRDYFTLAGWINYWDLQISFVWLALFGVRMISMFQNHVGYYNEDHHAFKWKWMVAQTYMVFWGLQAASLSARSLVLFQTSNYFGVLLRMMQNLIAEMMRFMFVLALVLVGFVFGLYYIQGGYDNEHAICPHDWYTGFRYLFQLTVGAGDFSEIEDIVENQITAQIFTILYIMFATVLMMNLLIALMTTTFDNVYSQARTESSFAIAEATFDLSHRSRFMPAPICIYVFAIASIIHVLNFIPALIWPTKLNVYNLVNHYQYKGLTQYRCSINGCGKICPCCCKKVKRSDDDVDRRCCLCRKSSISTSDDDLDKKCCDDDTCRKKCCLCRKSSTSVELKVNETGFKDVYKLTTRGRVWKYYASTLFCSDNCTPKWIEKKLTPERFDIHHTGCYSCIPTELGAKDTDKDRSTCHGITLNEYAEEYESTHNFSLDPQDTVLLKHLTVDTLFCKHCYRPFDPRNPYNLTDSLLTPFWALSEIISIYLFPLTVWIPLIIVYSLLTLLQNIGDLMNDDESEAPNVPDYDRQYFPKETLNAGKRDEYVD